MRTDFVADPSRLLPLSLCALMAFTGLSFVCWTSRHAVKAAPPAEKTTPTPKPILPPPPYRFSYTMPLDGYVAIDICDKKTGRVVRRLAAEVLRAKGTVEEAWDLKDDNGQYVPAGEYSWKAIARPPFKNTYEITVNHAGQPAWPAPPPAKGGGYWLGDHSAPIAAAAVGDLIFLGCPVAEGGHSIIAVDREGNKVWGEGALQLGFFGPKRIAVDERCAYLIKESFIRRIDPQNGFKAQDVYTEKPTRTLPNWPVMGGAGRGGRLYISYNAKPASWLSPSFTAEQLDPKRSVPMVWLKKGNGSRSTRGDKNYEEFEYDELMKFYATFLSDVMPDDSRSLSGAPIPSSTAAYFGDAPAEGALAGNLMAAFKQPITVGTVLVPDAKIQVYALKPGARLPEPSEALAAKEPDLLGGVEETIEQEGAFNEADWVALPIKGTAGKPGLALAPFGGFKTQALRFGTQRLTFALVTARRFEDLAPAAERILGEGEATARGGWSVRRDPATPINKYDPARMALVWDKPVTLRGVSLLTPTPLSTTGVDYWIGPAGADPKSSLNDDTHWKEAGTIEPEVFGGYAAQPPALRSVDFGALVTTRAVRVRAIEPEGYRRPPYGTAAVEGIHKAGFDSIIAYKSLGDDATLPPELHERITEYQLPDLNDPKGKLKVLRHIPIAKPGFLTFDKAGTLYAFSDGQIVTVPLNGGEPRVVVKREEVTPPADELKDVQTSFYKSAAYNVERYAGLDIDDTGLLHLADTKTHIIKVFDGKTGKIVRTIGTPGGPRIGKFDPTRLENPVGLTIDSSGKIWVAEARWQPKRVSRWSRDGKFEKQFMGPTGYGGGGWIDERNRNVLNYDGMKFVIDWDKRTWKLDSILHCQSLSGSIYAARPDRVVYFNNRRYLVGDPGGNGSYFDVPIAGIYEERDGVAVPLAAVGNMGAWGDIDLRPDLRKAFGKIERERYGFCWWDKNSDGVPQAEEVRTTTKHRLQPFNGARVGNDLSLYFGGLRLKPSGFATNGAPQYDLSKIEDVPSLVVKTLAGPGGANWTTEDGRTFVTGNRLIAADGKTILWEYPDKFLGGVGYYAAGMGMNRPAGLLLGELKPIGNFKLKNAQGGEEEYFVNNSDQGDWFVYTGDGMLVGCIFGGPVGQGQRYWTMPQWEPGKVDLSDVRLHQEHYHGSVIKTEDGKVYAVAGKDWNSVVRVEGLEQLHRLNGNLTVTRQQVDETEAWVLRTAELERQGNKPKVAKMPYTRNTIGINGSHDDWPEELFFTIHEYWEHSLISHELITHSQAALAYNDQNLYIAAWAMDDSPMKNSAPETELLFKYGDALDVLLGLDPKADPKRTQPVKGDLRLVISMVKGKPVVMAYRYKVDGASPEKRKHFQSPVGEVYIDVVEQIADAQVAVRTSTDRKGRTKWMLEASIPWKSLGMEYPKVNQQLRGDVGLLQSDQNGVRTVSRLYWSGKTQTVVSDIPSEAKIVPSVWGELVATEPEDGMHFGPNEPELVP